MFVWGLEEDFFYPAATEKRGEKEDILYWNLPLPYSLRSLRIIRHLLCQK